MKFQITPQNGRLGGRVPSADVTAGLINVFRIINSWLANNHIGRNYKKMPESTINAVITALGSLIGGIIGAYATIKVAKEKPSKKTNGSKSRFPLVEVIAGTVIGAVTTLVILAFLGLFQANKPTETTVRANAGWVGTGLILSSGQLLIIQSEGVVDYNGQDPAIGNSSPNGDGSSCNKATTEAIFNQKFEIDCLITDISWGALVGRIGDGSPFLIGSNYQSTTKTSGELYLGINDCCDLSDNTGEFKVTISLP